MALIIWDQPDDDEDVDKVEIQYSTDDVSYSSLTTINAKDGSGDWITQYDDTAHSTGHYKIRFLNTTLTAGSYSTAREVAYSLLTYSSVSLVDKQVQNLDSNITDPTKRDFILNAESHLDGIMKYSFRTGTVKFDEAKHGILRELTTKRTVRDCINYDIENQFGTSAGSLLIDSLTSDIEEGEERLKDQMFVKFLKNL